MVYPGKPSAGCLNCKKRKIKCDEARPACGQCISTRRVCPGYIERFDLVLRDQTKILHQKAERKNQKAKHNQISVGAESATRSPKLVAELEALKESLITNTFVSRSLRESPIDSAICLFFNNFILIPRHLDGQRGYLECLLPLYTSAPQDSLLSLTTSSVALALSGGNPHRRVDYKLSRGMFGKALRMAASVIQDPDESIKDETLLAVLLLGFYERVTSAVGSSTLSGSHDAGALALIKHRGQRNSQSEMSTRLSLAVHTQIVELAEYSKTPPTDLVEHASDLPRNTASRFTQISAQAVNLRRFAQSAFHNPLTISQESITAILNRSRRIDSTMEYWADSVPESWAFRAASGFDCPPGVSRETFVYQDRVDVYEDHTFVSVWNSYRSDRIMVLSVMLDCISRLWSHVGEAPLQESSAVLQAIQELVDGICASVPYQLGTKLEGGTFDQHFTEYPYIGTVKSPAEQRRAAASLGGWNLLEPLKSTLGAAGLRQGQKEWVLGQLRRIRRIYNIPSRWHGPPKIPEVRNGATEASSAVDKCQASVSSCDKDLESTRELWTDTGIDGIMWFIGKGDRK